MGDDVWRWTYQQDLNDPWADSVDGGRCQYGLFRWHAYQCSRKPKEIIGGYGFCTQHAKIIRSLLNHANTD